MAQPSNTNVNRQRPSQIRSTRSMHETGASPSSSPRKGSPSSAGVTALCVDSAQDYDWCKYLVKSVQSAPIRLEVPTMFLFSKPSRAYFSLSSSPSREVSITQGMSAWASFFPSQSTDQSSVYLAFDRTGVKKIDKSSEAHHYATHTLDTFAIIKLDFELKEFVTVRWSGKTGVNVLYDEEEAKKPELTRANSTFQHDLARFQYAGRLKKSSFSPMLPYNSTLTGKMVARLKVRSPKARRSIGSQSADAMVAAVCRFMQRGVEMVGSMIMHVIETGEGRWLLFNVTEVQWSSSPSLQPLCLPPLKQVPEEPLEPRVSARSSLKDWGLSASLKRVPYVDLSEIQQNNIRLYPSIAAKRSHYHHRSMTVIEKPTSVLDHPIDHVVSQLDRKSGDVKLHRELLEDSRRLKLTSSTNPGHIQRLATKAYTACIRDDSLKRFFRLPQGPTINHLSGMFEQAITSVHNGSLAKRISTVHKKFGVTEEDFTHFVDIFTSALRTELCPEDVELITRQMLRYKPEIVTA